MFIDIFCILILAFGFYMGYSKGIIKSFFGIISIFIAILVTLKFSFIGINFIEKLTGMDARLSILLGLILSFVLIVFLIRLVGRGFEKVLETAEINFINKLVGGSVSALIGLMLFSSAIWFFDRLHLIGEETRAKSTCFPTLHAVPEKTKWIWTKAKPLFTEFWDKTQQALDEFEKKKNNASPSGEQL